MALTNQQWLAVNNAVKSIYAPAGERQTRENVLQALYSVIYFDFADFCYVVSDDGADARIVDPVVLTRFSESFIADYEYMYENKYGQMDYTKWCVNSDESIAFLEADIIDDAVRHKTKYYKEFLVPRGLLHSMGCYIISGSDHYPSAVTMYRDTEHSAFSSSELEILNILLPHLENRMNLCDMPYSTGGGLNSADLYLINTYALTRRETEIARTIADGLSNEEISNTLNISIHTVKKHITHIFEKTGTANRGKLIQLINHAK